MVLREKIFFTPISKIAFSFILETTFKSNEFFPLLSWVSRVPTNTRFLTP